MLTSPDLVALGTGPGQQGGHLPPGGRRDEGDLHRAGGDGAHGFGVGPSGQPGADGVLVGLELGEVARHVVEVVVLGRVAHPLHEQLGGGGDLVEHRDAGLVLGEDVRPAT